MQSPGSDHIPINVNLSHRLSENNDDGGQSVGIDTFSSFHQSSRTAAGHILSTSTSSVDVGTSCGNSCYFMENDDEFSFCIDSWGSSCKRKALEGTSSEPYPDGDTGFFSEAQNPISGTVPSSHNSSSSLNISAHIVNSSGVGSSGQMNPISGVRIGGIASGSFPHSGVARSTDDSTRNGEQRFDFGHQEPAPFSLPSAENSVRRSTVRSTLQSSRSIYGDSLDFERIASPVTNSRNSPNYPHSRHGPILNRNVPFTWNASLDSRTNNSVRSLAHPRDRGAGLREEANYRSTMRNNAEHPMFVPETEMRSLVQDQPVWSLGTGSSSSSSGGASSSQMGPSTSLRPLSTYCMPRHSIRTQNQPRLSEFAPWTMFPSAESETGVSREQYSGHSFGHSSREEADIPLQNIHVRRQPYSRHASLMRVPIVEGNGWRSLATDIDERQRLVSEIHHVLTAMRRGENLRSEDYTLFDPYINGIAEFHDRHRDMRLDVDNMSYEELLALEERIGDVNTGLSEETILKSMKQRNHSSFTIGVPSKIEPCCICQEEYVTGEVIGTLDCGHDFHTNCVKVWLIQKNTCPICKMPALGT